jgi:hypothetical protein
LIKGRGTPGGELMPEKFDANRAPREAFYRIKYG